MARSKEIFEVFFRSKPANILVELRRMTHNKNYGSVLAKSANCTYSHAVKILQEMEKANLINFEKVGRIKNICLTETGSQLAEHIEKIREMLHELD